MVADGRGAVARLLAAGAQIGAQQIDFTTGAQDVAVRAVTASRVLVVPRSGLEELRRRQQPENRVSRR